MDILTKLKGGMAGAGNMPAVYEVFSDAHDEIERLRGFISRQYPGFDLDEAMALFDAQEGARTDHLTWPDGVVLTGCHAVENKKEGE